MKKQRNGCKIISTLSTARDNKKIMSVTITISEDLRQKLETLAGPDKTADDLANEVIARYIQQREQDKDWRDLVSFSLKNGAASGYTEANMVDLIHQTRRER